MLCSQLLGLATWPKWATPLVIMSWAEIPCFPSSAPLSFQAWISRRRAVILGNAKGNGQGGDELKVGEKSLKDCSLPLYFSLFYNECSYHVPSSDSKEEDKV